MMPFHCSGTWSGRIFSLNHNSSDRISLGHHGCCVQAVVAFWSSTRTCRLAATRTSRSCSTCWHRNWRQLLKPRSHRRLRPANRRYRLRGLAGPHRQSPLRSRSWQTVLLQRRPPPALLPSSERAKICSKNNKMKSKRERYREAPKHHVLRCVDRGMIWTSAKHFFFANWKKREQEGLLSIPRCIFILFQHAGFWFMELDVCFCYILRTGPTEQTGYSTGPQLHRFDFGVLENFQKF